MHEYGLAEHESNPKRKDRHEEVERGWYWRWCTRPVDERISIDEFARLVDPMTSHIDDFIDEIIPGLAAMSIWKSQILGEGVTTQAGDNLRAASSDWLASLMLNVNRRRSLHIRYSVCNTCYPAFKKKSRGSSMPPALFRCRDVMSAGTHTQAWWPSKYGAVIRTGWLNDGTMAWLIVWTNYWMIDHWLPNNWRTG